MIKVLWAPCGATKNWGTYNLWPANGDEVVNPCSMPFNLSFGEIESMQWMIIWLYKIFSLISVLRWDFIVWPSKCVFLFMAWTMSSQFIPHLQNCQMCKWATKNPWLCNMQALECHLVLDFTTAAIVTYATGSWMYTRNHPLTDLLIFKSWLQCTYCLKLWNAWILRREKYAHFAESRRPENYVFHL